MFPGAVAIATWPEQNLHRSRPRVPEQLFGHRVDLTISTKHVAARIQPRAQSPQRCRTTPREHHVAKRVASDIAVLESIADELAPYRRFRTKRQQRSTITRRRNAQRASESPRRPSVIGNGNHRIDLTGVALDGDECWASPWPPPIATTFGPSAARPRSSISVCASGSRVTCLCPDDGLTPLRPTPESAWPAQRR